MFYSRLYTVCDVRTSVCLRQREEGHEYSVLVSLSEKIVTVKVLKLSRFFKNY